MFRHHAQHRTKSSSNNAGTRDHTTRIGCMVTRKFGGCAPAALNLRGGTSETILRSIVHRCAIAAPVPSPGEAGCNVAAGVIPISAVIVNESTCPNARVYTWTARRPKGCNALKTWARLIISKRKFCFKSCLPAFIVARDHKKWRPFQHNLSYFSCHISIRTYCCINGSPRYTPSVVCCLHTLRSTSTSKVSS